MHTFNADTMGADGVWRDPVWRLDVDLTPVEQTLLRTWWVRRLAFVAHAGAATITTTQNYSRLEHSLGVLALVAHFAPEDVDARATALLHDVGHLPLSHSLEGIAGLEHHGLGRSRIRELSGVMEPHGISAESIIARDEGMVSSPLRAAPGRLKLDHLDSFVRSGQAHGRTVMSPQEILSRCQLVDGAIDTDDETASELTRLIVAEAHAQRAPANVVPTAVMRQLVRTALDAQDPLFTAASLSVMTDDELWASLLSSPSTRESATAFRRDPGAWRILEQEPLGPAGSPEPLEHVITRGYLSLPTVEGTGPVSDDVAALERALPIRYWIVGPPSWSSADAHASTLDTPAAPPVSR